MHKKVAKIIHIKYKTNCGEIKSKAMSGGVSSSLGKGIIAASLAKLLQAQGYRTTIQKLDPYINIDWYPSRNA